MTQNSDGARSAWFTLEGETFDAGEPMSLVTLRLDAGADDAALGFIEKAERRALREWAASGDVLMAFVTDDRRELNLIVASNDDDTRRIAEDLPSVVAELADVHVRSVSAFEPVSKRKLVTH